MLTVILSLALSLGGIAGEPKPASLSYRISNSGAGNSYRPIFSADGKHAAFVSHANNLVTNDDLGPHLDLFVRDLASSNSVLVSVSTNGFGGANDSIGLFTLSSNAQLVAFESAASNLAPGNTNRTPQIFFRDLAAGQTTLITVGTNGAVGNGPSGNPCISEDGRYIAFESTASNLVTNDFNGTNDVFMRDVVLGTTVLVSESANGSVSANGASRNPLVSSDGRIVAFVSRATTLAEGATNGVEEIFVRNLASRTTTWASRRSGPGSNILRPAHSPVATPDGRFVAFKLGSNVVARHEVSAVNHALTLRTVVIPSGGHLSDAPLSISTDGRYVAYSAGPTNQSGSLLEATLLRVDFEETLECVTHPVLEDPSVSVTNPCWASVVVSTNILTNRFSAFPHRSTTLAPAMSGDGQRFIFLAGMRPAGGVMGYLDEPFGVYFRDMSNNFSLLLTSHEYGNPGTDLGASTPTIAAGGLLAAWDSPNASLAEGDHNLFWDVFWHDLKTGETHLASTRHPALPAQTGLMLAQLGSQALSANGRMLALTTLDPLAGGGTDTNFAMDALVFDAAEGTNQWLGGPFSVQNAGNTVYRPTNGVAQIQLSGDGQSALLGVSDDRRAWTFFRRSLHSELGDIIPAPRRQDLFSIEAPTIDHRGLLIAFQYNGPLYPGLIQPAVPDDNNASDILVCDYGAGSDPGAATLSPITRLVSLNAAGTATANGASINPIISPDSRFIAFFSRATNLTPDSSGNTNFQLYVRDMGRNATRIISYGSTVSPEPGGISTEAPSPAGATNTVFSADSRHLVFQAGGSNLIYRHDLEGGYVTNISAHQEGAFTAYITNLARVTNPLICADCANPSVSADGQYVAYETRRGGNAVNDVFLRDLHSGSNELVSVNFGGMTGGNGSSFGPLVSHDARFVVFASRASDLVDNDRNGVADIFVRDRFTQLTHCLSQNYRRNGTANRASSQFSVSADGRTVVFQSFASDLVPGDHNDTRDVFVVALGGPDSDGDGMEDDWEMAYFGTLDREGAGDFDGDGASDATEYRAGTNPTDNGSVLRALSLTMTRVPSNDSARVNVLVWTAVPGRTYRVEHKAEIESPWNTVGANISTGGTTASCQHLVPDTETRGFYRVMLVE